MKEIRIHCGPLKKRAVIVDKGEITDVFVEHEPGSGVGNIYKGVVDNVVPGMQSAFVNIGLEKNAFLFADDVLGGDKTDDIRTLVKKGQDVFVQITKEASGVKGARVTASITVPGHFLVMMPFYNYIGVSKKIADEEEKERLRRVVDENRSGETGYIIRTDAVNATDEELKREMNYLEGEWAKILKDQKVKKAPRLLYREDDLLLSVIRDYFDETVDRIVIDDEAEAEKARRITSVFTPRRENAVFFEEGNVFARDGVETKIKKLLQKKVWLDNGAYLIIDYTEALTVIDVNTGKFTGESDLMRTVVKTNRMAAREIARQVRLRAIGGIIVIDFIDMETDEERAQVLAELEEACAKDKIKTNVMGFAPLGLVEMTRKKTRLSLADAVQCSCPYCDGDGRILSETVILDDLLQEVRTMAKRDQSPITVLRMNPYLADKLGEYVHLLPEREVFVRRDPGLHMEDYNVAFLNQINDQEGLVRVK